MPTANADGNDLFVDSTDPAKFRVGLGMRGGKIFRAEPFRPVMVFGPQRSGKTTGAVIPAVLEWDGPCFVTSVRFDVIQNTLAYRKRLGKVYVFDPTGHAAERFDYCVGWTPLDGVETWDDAVRRSNGLAESLTVTGMEEGGFWTSQARMLLTPLLFIAARAKASMREVLQWLDLPNHMIEGRLEPFLERISPTNEDDTRDIQLATATAQAFSELPDRQYQGTTSTAASMLEVFRYDSVEKQCRAGGLEMDEFLNGDSNTLYVCAPPTSQKDFRPLLTALAREVVTRAFDHDATYGHDRPLRLMMCLDEAGNIARLEDLDVLATTAAGSNIQLVSVFHDMSQLKYCYGEDRAHLIQNNHSGLLFMPGNRDPETSEYLVSNLREEQVVGLNHHGWSPADLRTMVTSQALCIYGRTPPVLLSIRRSFEDPQLVERSKGNVPEESTD
jgi:type IV secretion system protein VirD4